jgi:hypothetical protein
MGSLGNEKKLAKVSDIARISDWRCNDSCTSKRLTLLHEQFPEHILARAVGIIGPKVIASEDRVVL